MNYKFQYNFIRMTPRKIRLVIQLIKNLSLKEALEQLEFLPKRAAVPVLKIVKSAIAAIKTDKNSDINKLKINELTCSTGPTLKRRRYRSKGRADTIRKRSSHITIIISDEEINKQDNKEKSPKINKK